MIRHIIISHIVKVALPAMLTSLFLLLGYLSVFCTWIIILLKLPFLPPPASCPTLKLPEPKSVINNLLNSCSSTNVELVCCIMKSVKRKWLVEAALHYSSECLRCVISYYEVTLFYHLQLLNHQLNLCYFTTK